MGATGDRRRRALIWSLVYLLAGFSWVILADLFPLPQEARNWKGFLLVVGTASGLYVLLNRLFRKLEAAQIRCRESERRFSALLSYIPGVVYSSRPDWKIRVAGPQGLDVLGLPQEEETDLPLLLPAEDRERVPSVIGAKLASGEAFELTHRLVTPSGRARWVRNSGRGRYEEGKLVSIDGLITDITDQVELERIYRQAQKMESLGQVSAAVAHDFNNLLTGIIGFTEFILSRTDPGSELAPDLIEILQLADRASSLIRHLLVFSRKHAIDPITFDLRTLVGNSTRMLQRILGQNIDIFFDYKEGTIVRADPDQIDQVLLNLAVNARDAMPEGGTIRVRVEPVLLAEMVRDSGTEIPEGYYVILSVQDTGQGMTPEVLERAFEPFFTTKDPGSGTGLGLATVYGIVRQHGGRIAVESEPGVGTTFRIYLPRARELEGQQALQSKEELIPTGSESILLIEDDLALQNLIHRILEDLGYQVLSVPDLAKAGQNFQAENSRFDLILSDGLNPGTGIRRFLAQVRASSPQMKVLFMSGYAEKAEEARLMGAAFLSKPFTPRTLSRKIREVLQA